MDDLVLARALHVISVIMWIGGVGFVTTVTLGAVRRFKQPAEQIRFFEEVEGRFAVQARVTTVLAGASGLYMVWAMDIWHRFTDPAFWWMAAMVLIWLLFTLMLFVLEPLFLHRWFLAQAKLNPQRTFGVIHTLHWVLLSVSLITAFAAVAGVHGGF